jgi:hypothetical protein
MRISPSGIIWEHEHDQYLDLWRSDCEARSRGNIIACNAVPKEMCYRYLLFPQLCPLIPEKESIFQRNSLISRCDCNFVLETKWWGITINTLIFKGRSKVFGIYAPVRRSDAPCVIVLFGACIEFIFTYNIHCDKGNRSMLPVLFIYECAWNFA